MTKILCTICARAGSQGVKNKNLREIAGHPLITHTIKQAINSNLFDTIAVSSDSNEILEIALKYGATDTIERPAHMATATAGKYQAIQHCVKEIENKKGHHDWIIDLDPTSPLRTPQDIIDAYHAIAKTDAPNLITGCDARRSPYFNLVAQDKKGYVYLPCKTDFEVLRRQDAPSCYDMNASIYIWRYDALMTTDSLFQERTIIHVMPAERSLDIDTELDFKIVKFLMEDDSHES